MIALSHLSWYLITMSHNCNLFNNILLYKIERLMAHLAIDRSGECGIFYFYWNSYMNYKGLNT